MYIKLNHIGSYWIKLDQIGSNWIKLDQIGSYCIKVTWSWQLRHCLRSAWSWQTCSWYGLNLILNISIRGLRLSLNLVYLKLNKASFFSEVGGSFFWFYVITQGICNKFIKVKFCVGCMISWPNSLLQHWTFVEYWWD